MATIFFSPLQRYEKLFVSRGAWRYMGLKRVLYEERYLSGTLFFSAILTFFPFQNMKCVSSPGIGQFMLAIIPGL